MLTADPDVQLSLAAKLIAVSADSSPPAQAVSVPGPSCQIDVGFLPQRMSNALTFLNPTALQQSN